MSDAKIAAAGIELETAGPATLRDTMLLNGILQPNQEALVQITPRFPGVIREVRKRVGDTVAAGEVLIRIESNQSLTSYELRAPIAGTIIDRQAALGEYASEQKAVFTIADLSTVWVDFSVYRRDLAKVRIGDRIEIDAEDGGPPVEAKISLRVAGRKQRHAERDGARRRRQPGRAPAARTVRDRAFAAGREAGSARRQVSPLSRRWKTAPWCSSAPVRNSKCARSSSARATRERVEVMFGLLEGDRYAARNSFVIKAEIGKASAAHEH